MRPMFAGFALALVMLATAHGVWASIYVPGHVRDGVYIRPHFVSAPSDALVPSPGLKAAPPATDQILRPLLPPTPGDRKLGEES